MVKNDFQTPDECPVCGEDVPPGARACPGCGADERTGWDEDATRYDGLDLPDGAFDDGHSSQKRRWFESPLWIGVALALLILFIVAFVSR